MRHAIKGPGRIGWLALLAAAVWAAPGWAQQAADPDAQNAAVLRRVCKADYAAHCTGDDPAPAIEKACLAQFYVNLSQGCQAALDAARGDTGGGNGSGADQGGQ